jgi:DNA-binding NarL/FixJ family response regulator
VLVLADGVEGGRVFRFLCAGASGCLLKPCAAEQLASAIVAAEEGRLLFCRNSEEGLRRWCRRLFHDPRFQALTPRECDVMMGVLHGLSEGEIAGLLRIATNTAHTHRVKVPQVARPQPAGAPDTVPQCTNDHNNATD